MNVAVDGTPTGAAANVEDGSDWENGFFRVTIFEPSAALAAVLSTSRTMELLVDLPDGRRMRVRGAWVHEIISDNGPLRCFLEADQVVYEG